MQVVLLQSTLCWWSIGLVSEDASELIRKKVFVSVRSYTFTLFENKTSTALFSHYSIAQKIYKYIIPGLSIIKIVDSFLNLAHSYLLRLLRCASYCMCAMLMTASAILNWIRDKIDDMSWIVDIDGIHVRALRSLYPSSLTIKWLQTIGMSPEV